MHNIFLITPLILAPAALLLYYFWVRDRWAREPWSVIWPLLGLGCLAVIPAAVVEVIVAGADFEVKSVSEAFFGAFFVAGLTEELVKFFAVYFYTRRLAQFDEEYDGIVYAVAVGIGFAFLENVLYVLAALMAGESMLGTAFARAFTAVPSHALDGVIIGFFLGRAHFMADPADRLKTNALGILIAVLFHGLYDFFVFLLFVIPQSASGWCVVGLFWTLFVQWGTAYRMIKSAQTRSAAQHVSPAEPPARLPPVSLNSEPGASAGTGYPPFLRRYCIYCGKALQTGARYCTQCGARIPC